MIKYVYTYWKSGIIWKELYITVVLRKSAHLAQALQIGIFDSLASMSMW